MRTKYKVIGVAVVTVLVTSSAAVAWSATTPRRGSQQCAKIKTQVADREALLAAAAAGGGLTPEQQSQLDFERAINRAALKHCGEPAGGSGSGSGGQATQPPASSTPSSPAPANPAPANPAPATGSFPTAATTGVPAGWSPTTTRTTDLHVDKAGTVVENIRLVNANLFIDAPNVTVRKVEIKGGYIINDVGGCKNGLVIEDTSVLRSDGQVTSPKDPPAVGTGGYTARRVKIEGLPEGFRVGGRSQGCGPVTIENSYASVRFPDNCGDWHGDGIQGYDGTALTVRNVALTIVESSACGGTAPFFYPDKQGNTSVDIENLLVKGGGYPFRLGTAGKVKGLRIVDGSWAFGPIAVQCSALSEWEAQVVSSDASKVVKAVPCNTSGS